VSQIDLLALCNKVWEAPDKARETIGDINYA
jgi:hypothetical protein